MVFYYNAHESMQQCISNRCHYHFWVEVLNILRVENSHESLRAHGLAAVFLSDHQCNVLWVVLKMVDERLALASYGLDDTHIFL